MKNQSNKIAIFQPLIPKYRVPIFQAINSSKSIDLTVYAGESIGSLKAVNDKLKFKQVLSPVKTFHLFKFELKSQLHHITVYVKHYDAIIASWDVSYITLIFLIIKCKLHKVPIILWGHGYSKNASNWRDCVRNFYGKTCDAVLVYSDTTANKLINSKNYRRKKIFVAQNAISHTDIETAIQYWNARPAELEKFKSTHNLDPNCSIIFVSRLEKKNKIELMFNALREILKKYKNARLIIVGEGAYKQKLEEIASKINLLDKVIFTGPIYDEMHLAPWMLCSSIFCYPTNIGLSVHHAFCYGLPVVTTDNFAVQNPEVELITNGENSLLYTDNSWKDMSEKWDKLISNKALRIRMGKEAKKLVSEKYTITNMVNGVLDSINYVVK